MRKPRPVHQNGYAVSRDLTSVLVCTEKLKPLGRETRRHPRRQLDKLAGSLAEFGFVLPIIIDLDCQVVAGWGLVLAARKLGLAQVPAVTITDLDEAKLRLLRLALNRLGEDSSWADDTLKLEFSDVLTLDTNIDLQISGFEMAELDVRLRPSADDEEDEIPRIDQQYRPITKPGDIWVLDQHRIVCGDALQAENYTRLLGDEHAQMLFTDPPWNVPIKGHVSGLGAVKHAEFAMASGEMSSVEFESFLATALGHAARHAVDGSIHFVVIDWRHVKDLLGATAETYTEMKNLCIWNKSNAGMGSFYRSKHELVFVFKKGKAPHINNIELGRFGRYRSNVWDYPGQNTLNNSAKGKLSLHPTCKPVALVADTMRDCSKMNGIVLDPFGGAGTTLIAAERTGRRARLIEIEPRFVDCTVRRWQQLTGRIAVHAETGVPFGTTEASEADIGSGQRVTLPIMGADHGR
ncbi:DNA methyltransferase [Bradyrhizobium sp. AUGA SZCCT0182]|uniref:site-specific DNA-methyltransferase n=2 Tax=unclassified Bradyrhizobium TaxID=2631580 RepID=UPI001BADF63E|nr:DNA methyltransferase [Bradyrhizobium sp. AUGA SZCCT0182]MBR1237470.1 DNA methylase N-4 [Bradyrhizobium sp. AUGA SZCCT0182]